MGATPALQYSQGSSQGPPDTESRVPVINLKDGTRLAGDDAPRRKDLEQWLNEHPGFVADTGAFIPVSLLFIFVIAYKIRQHLIPFASRQWKAPSQVIGG